MRRLVLLSFAAFVVAAASSHRSPVLAAGETHTMVGTVASVDPDGKKIRVRAPTTSTGAGTPFSISPQPTNEAAFVRSITRVSRTVGRGSCRASRESALYPRTTLKEMQRLCGAASNHESNAGKS